MTDYINSLYDKDDIYIQGILIISLNMSENFMQPMNQHRKNYIKQDGAD